MSVMAGSAARRPVLRGITGGVAGLLLVIGVTIIGFSIGDRGATVGEAGAVGLSQAQVFEALAQHASREYGPSSNGASAAATVAMRQLHLTREYGTFSEPAGATQAGQLFEHTLREEAAP